MAQTFARWLGGVGDLPAGMFTLRTESGRAALSCPLCATVYDLPPMCGPDPVGRTLYAVHCTAPTCSWWDFAVLESHWEAV